MDVQNPYESQNDQRRVEEPTDTQANRRSFLLSGMSLLVLAGCGQGTRLADLPEPSWRDDRERRRDLTRADRYPDRRPSPGSGTSSVPAGVLPRNSWAAGPPVPTLMDRMLPISYITVHHDGMSPFYATDEVSTKGRLEQIRRGHRSKNWGDIGYHFAIDRAGRVWQCRPLTWQGAHVKDHNEGNLGILVMGNFDRQSPTQPQLNQMRRFTRQMMSSHHVPAGRLRTHQEWAATACPGRNLQSRFAAMRASGMFT